MVTEAELSTHIEQTAEFDPLKRKILEDFLLVLGENRHLLNLPYNPFNQESREKYELFLENIFKMGREYHISEITSDKKADWNHHLTDLIFLEYVPSKNISNDRICDPTSYKHIQVAKQDIDPDLTEEYLNVKNAIVLFNQEEKRPDLYT
jgi:hypothetical protein